MLLIIENLCEMLMLVIMLYLVNWSMLVPIKINSTSALLIVLYIIHKFIKLTLDIVISVFHP